MKNKGQILTDVNRVFDTPFEVQEKTVTQDENGIQKEQWTKKYKLFADGKNLYGKKYERVLVVEIFKENEEYFLNIIDDKKLMKINLSL